jgi:hydantoinase/carbamoylase family amidase
VFDDDRRSPGLFLDDASFEPAFRDRIAGDEEDHGPDDRDLGVADLGIPDIQAVTVAELRTDAPSGAPYAHDVIDAPAFDTDDVPDAPAFRATLDADVGVTDHRPAHIDPVPDASRISATIQRLVQVSEDASTAGTRLALTPEERAAHARFARLLKEAGFSARTDPFGNTIGERPGASDRPFITLGTYLDAATGDGPYDGLVGAVGALEVGQMIRESGIVTQHPLRIAAFAGHSGARFGESCLGSRAVAGRLDAGDARRLCDPGGQSLAQALGELGFDVARVACARWSDDDVAGYLEMDVDRRPVVPTEATSLGIVDTVLGRTRLLLDLQGRAGHAGSITMDGRGDALAAAAEMVLEVERTANESRRRFTCVTVGSLDVVPNAVTAIPDRVTFSVDVRDVDGDEQRAMAGALLARFEQIANRRGLELTHTLDADRQPTLLPYWLRRLMQQACVELRLPHRVIVSGASHDAQALACRMPAAVLLVPAHHGHCQTPFLVDAVATGARALFRCLMRLDRFLADEIR